MSSNALTTWGYFYPREIYLQQRQQGRRPDSRYIFELTHTDCYYATRIEATFDIITAAQAEFNRIMPVPLHFNNSTPNLPLFAIVSGFSTAVRLSIDIIGELNDCRQSVAANSMFIIPSNELQIERHNANRAIARNDALRFSNNNSSNQQSTFVQTSFRFNTSGTNTSMQVVNTPINNVNDNENEMENEGEDNMEDETFTEQDNNQHHDNNNSTNESDDRDVTPPQPVIVIHQSTSSSSRQSRSRNICSHASSSHSQEGHNVSQSNSTIANQQVSSSGSNSRYHNNESDEWALASNVNNLSLETRDQEDNNLTDEAERERQFLLKRKRQLISTRRPKK